MNDVPDHLDIALWGPEPTSEEVRAAERRNNELHEIARRKVCDAAMPTALAASELRISARTVRRRLAAGTLIGLKEGNQWRLPDWQFDLSSTTGAVGGLALLLDLFSDDVVTLSRWATAKNVELHDRTPAEVLKSGDVGQVIVAAKYLSSGM